MPRAGRSNEGHVMFHCPGCECGHMVSVNGTKMENGSGWQWNGSLDLPTFSPSVLVRSRGFTKAGEEAYERWRLSPPETPAPEFECQDTVCHSFVTDGRIQFLSDCTHALKGQTVDLPEWP